MTETLRGCTLTFGEGACQWPPGRSVSVWLAAGGNGQRPTACSEPSDRMKSTL